MIELNRSRVIEKLQSKMVSIDEFNYDKLKAPPILSVLSQYDVDRLYNVATSARYSGNVEKKFKAINEILNPRGFRKLSAGTNRLTYKFMEDQSFVIKTAYGRVALSDTPAEYRNQFIYKPFVTKVHEVDPSGTVGLFERIEPIKSREEFLSIANDVYDLINSWFIGKYIMADIGSNYFMNWGYRRNFGPVLCDFPYVYEIDGNKLYCSAPKNNSPTGICGGLIDFDDGFNHLYCQKCGLRYRVKEIAKAVKEEKIIIRGGKGGSKMKIELRRGDTVIGTSNDYDGLLGRATHSVRTVYTEVPERFRQRPTGMVITTNRGNDSKEHHTVKQVDTQPKERRLPPQRGDNNRGLTVVRTVGEQNDGQKVIQRQQSAEAIIASSDANNFGKMKERITELEGELRKSRQAVDDGITIIKAREVEAEEKDSTINELRATIVDLNTELEQAKADILKVESVNDDSTKLEKAYEQLERDYKDLKNRLQNTEIVCIEEQEKNKSLAEENQHYRKEVESLSATIAMRDEDISTLNKKSDELEAHIKELKNQEESTKPSDDQIKHYEGLISNYEAKLVALSNELAKKEEEINNLNAQIATMNQDITTAEASDSQGVILSELNEELNRVKNENYDLVDALVSSIDKFVPVEPVKEKVDIPDLAGFNCLDATVKLLSQIDENVDQSVDRYVLAIIYDDGSYLIDGDNNYLAISSISGIPVDSLVVKDTKEVVGEDVYKQYIAPEENEEV